jgi:hypothetical protein
MAHFPAVPGTFWSFSWPLEQYLALGQHGFSGVGGDLILTAIPDLALRPLFTVGILSTEFCFSSHNSYLLTKGETGRFTTMRFLGTRRKPST